MMEEGHFSYVISPHDDSVENIYFYADFIYFDFPTRSNFTLAYRQSNKREIIVYNLSQKVLF